MDTPAEEVLTLTDGDGHRLFVSRWMPSGPPKAAVQIAHGWAEHRRRYARPGAGLVAAGYAVYADDHLGHGETGLAAGGLGDFRPRGMEGVVDAVHVVTDRIRADLPGVPVFLLGHSWGSQIAKRYARRWGAELAGLLLTGTTHTAGGGDRRRRLAPEGATTAEERYAWLSSDPAEVRAYIEDPMCGFEALEVRPADPGRGYLEEGDDDAIPKDLPILVFNGAEDPVGGKEGAEALGDHYSSVGLERVTARSYAGGRHELFNDVMRDQVLADVIAWLDEVVAARR
ncbi:MAG TPA: alpha/beta hydrolase [Acidimicrobiales bacterium]|nr:alpha/beta hydrolase [Acidimicrobiales bacterium]